MCKAFEEYLKLSCQQLHQKHLSNLADRVLKIVEPESGDHHDLNDDFV